MWFGIYTFAHMPSQGLLQAASIVVGFCKPSNARIRPTGIAGSTGMQKSKRQNHTRITCWLSPRSLAWWPLKGPAIWHRRVTNTDAVDRQCLHIAVRWSTSNLYVQMLPMEVSAILQWPAHVSLASSAGQVHSRIKTSNCPESPRHAGSDFLFSQTLARHYMHTITSNKCISVCQVNG